MITTFKIFENKFIEEMSDIKVGDYLHVNYFDFFDEDVIDILKNNIGEVIEVRKSGNYPIKLKYNVVFPTGVYTIDVNNYDNLSFASDEEIKRYKIETDSNKYNL